MEMYAHIRTKNEIEYSNRIGNNYSNLELIYSKFIEAYNKVKNHAQDIQELYQEAFNQPACIEQDLIVIDYF